MFITLDPVVNFLIEDARGCLRDFPRAAIVLSSVALEAKRKSSLLARKLEKESSSRRRQNNEDT